MHGDFINDTDMSPGWPPQPSREALKASFSALSDNPDSHLDDVICFCYCTIFMIIEWHDTRFSHADWRIYASMNYVNIDLDNGLSPEQRQAIIQSRAKTSITFQNT